MTILEGILNKPLGVLNVGASGSVIIGGTLQKSFTDTIFVSSGSVLVSGSLTENFDRLQILSSGNIPIVGESDISLRSTTLLHSDTTYNGENAPYHQVVTWNGHPANGLSVKTRLGNLKGIFNISGEYGLYAGDGFSGSESGSPTSDTRYIRISNEVIEGHNLPIKLYDGEKTTIFLNPITPSFAVGNSIPTAFDTGTGIWMGKDISDDVYKFRIGNPTSTRLEWDGDSLNIIDASLEIAGSSAHLSFGNPSPTSSENGTGIWIDQSGFYAISSCAVQVKIDTDNGKFYAGGSSIILDSEGLKLLQTSASTVGVVWKTSVSDPVSYFPFIHDYTCPTEDNIHGATLLGNNLFMGVGAGNFEMGKTSNQDFFASANIGIGTYALHGNVIGYNNISIGEKSLELNNSGNHNVAIGKESLNNNLTGEFNVAVGYRTLYSGSSINYNIGLGYQALRSNLSSYNIGIGLNSLYSNTSGSYNIAVGYESMYYNTTGKNNIGIGVNALKGNSSLNGTGNYNIAIGYGALESYSDGYSNIAIGYLSSISNTTGYWNIGLGTNTLKNNVNGFQNIALGTSSLESNVSGLSNTAVGSVSLYQNIDGNDNVAFGYSSLNKIRHANDNTAIGNSAFAGLDDGEADGGDYSNFNTAVGRSSGWNFTSGCANVFLGAYSGQVSAGQINPVSNSIAIGYNSYTTSSSQIALGNDGILEIVTTGGLHVGGRTSPGVDNLIVDGKTLISGSATISDDLLVDGDLFISGSTTFTNYFPTTVSGSPTSRTHITNKGYIDDLTINRKKNLWIGGWKPRLSNGCSSASQIEMSSSKNVFDTLPFEHYVGSWGYANIPLPLDYDGEDMSAKLYWTTKTSGSGTVTWVINAVGIEKLDPLDQTITVNSYFVESGSVAGNLYITGVATLDLSGSPTAGDLVQFQVARIGDNATYDTKYETAYLIGALLEYGIE